MYYHTAVLICKSKAHLTSHYIEEVLQLAKEDLKTTACGTNYLINFFSNSNKNKME